MQCNAVVSHYIQTGCLYYIYLSIRFGVFVREYKEERNKELTFRDLPGAETATPSECMLLMEMTRKHQAKVNVSR